MRWIAVTLVCGLAAAGCKKKQPDKPPEPDPDERPQAQPAPPPDAAPSPTALAPSELPMCSEAKFRPLHALCRIGGPADKARFNCERPSPIALCPTFANWTCRTLSALTGETPPPIQYWATFDWTGAPVASGDVINTASMRPKGLVKAVEIHWKEPDDDAGARKAKQFADTIASWGCVRTDRTWQHQFDCGSWTATASYNDIIDDVIVEAALTGYSDCLPK